MMLNRRGAPRHSATAATAPRHARGQAATPQRAAKRSRGKMFRLGILIFVLGLAVVSYPFVSDFLAHREQDKVIASQDEVVSTSSEDDLTEEKALADSYNTNLLSSRTVVSDPFDPNRMHPNADEYQAVLNLNGDGVMGTLCIPELNLQTPIYHGTEDEVLQKGAGHIENTSLPWGGDTSHCVLAGHTGLPAVRIFDGLDQLKAGDYFVIKVLGEEHAYRVYGTEVVLPEKTESLVIQEGRDLVTLVTCTPYGVNTHRLLVHAERCEVPQDWYDRNAKPSVTTPIGRFEAPLWLFSLIGVGLACLIGLGIFLVRRHLRRKRL